MTKVEKELIRVVKEKMDRKNIKEGNPQEMYEITKRSNKDYFAKAQIGQMFFTAQGKDLRTVMKNLIKEIK